MTNKEKYINSFSGIEPSDKVKERIMNMTMPKKKVSLRILAIAFAVLTMLAVAMLTANAATDGELAQKIADTEVVQKFRILFNGAEMNPKDYKITEKQTTDENGNTQYVLEFSPDCGSEDGQFVIKASEGVEEGDRLEVKATNGDAHKYYLE